MEKEARKIKIPKAKAAGLFEVSWEVCNKVGGIHTVITSKAPSMLHYWRNYYLIGPYFPEKIKGEFSEETPSGQLQKIFNRLASEGIHCHSGKWLIKGQPNVILIDFKDFLPQGDQIKFNLWQDYRIDSLGAGFDFTEPVVFSTAAGKLIEEMASSLFKGRKTVAHFHEWLTAAGLLYLKKRPISVGTVFTTHATTLGRTLAYHNINFYLALADINPALEAEKYQVKAKYQIEKATALNCDVFTTVSAITAWEAERFLGRKADFLLFNGLDSERLLTFEELTAKHRLYRDRLREFLIFYFFPYYNFDLEETLFFFTASRYELRAKGVDVFIKALGHLNKQLTKIKSRKTVVVFFWIPSQTKEVKNEILESRAFFQDIKDSLEEVSQQTEERVLYALAEGKEIEKEDLFNKEFLFEVEKKFLKLKRQGAPPTCTHNLVAEKDEILEHFKAAGLENKKSDKVKVIFYPAYLTGHDGLTNLNYEESIQGCHFGIFPSFYEPWGYTPLETSSWGVSALTTDFAGFGRFCQELVQDKKRPGIFILERYNKTDQQVVKALADILLQFAKYSSKERVENKIQARNLAAFADWRVLVENYIKAQNQAAK